MSLYTFKCTSPLRFTSRSEKSIQVGNQHWFLPHHWRLVSAKGLDSPSFLQSHTRTRTHKFYSLRTLKIWNSLCKHAQRGNFECTAYTNDSDHFFLFKYTKRLGAQLGHDPVSVLVFAKSVLVDCGGCWRTFETTIPSLGWYHTRLMAGQALYSLLYRSLAAPVTQTPPNATYNTHTHTHTRCVWNICICAAHTTSRKVLSIKLSISATVCVTIHIACLCVYRSFNATARSNPTYIALDRHTDTYLRVR